MDINDYSGWTPRRPGAGFARRSVDAMLAPADAEVSGEVAVAPILQLPVHHSPAARSATQKSRFGAIALLLAAAFVATTAVAMYRAQHMSLPPVEKGLVETALPVIAPSQPEAEPQVEAAKPAVVAEPVQVAPAPPPPLRAKPRPSATAKPPPAKTSIPRCDCLGDVSVCGCIEP